MQFGPGFNIFHESYVVLMGVSFNSIANSIVQNHPEQESSILETELWKQNLG